VPEEELRVTIRLKDFATRGMKKFHGTVTRVAAKVRAKLMAVKSAVFSLRGALIALGAGIVLKGFMNAGLAMERFRVQIKAVLDGNEALAKQTLTWVREFARVTAFATDDVIQSYVTMRAAGIKVTKEMLTTVGNVAFAFSKGTESRMSDLALALVSMEAEVFKRFGLTWKIVGDQATISLDGMIRKTKKTMGAMREAILDLFAKKFPDTMQEAQEKVGGQLAIMKSNWFEFQAEAVEKGPFQALKALLVGVQEEMGNTGGATTLMGQVITESLIFVVRAAGWVATGIDAIKVVFLTLKRIGAEVLGFLSSSLAAWFEELTGYFDKGPLPWLMKKVFGKEAIAGLQGNLNDAAMAIEGFAQNMANAAEKTGKSLEGILDPGRARLGEKIDVLADRMRGAFNRIKKDAKTAIEEIDALSDKAFRKQFGHIKTLVAETKKAQTVQYEPLQEVDWSGKIWEETTTNIALATDLVKEYKQSIEDAQKTTKEMSPVIAVIADTWKGVASILIDSVLRAIDQAFEKSVNWKKLLQDILKDVGKMLMKKGMGMALGAVGAARGGVFNAFSERIPIRSYAGGGITQGPEIAIIGEGKKQEAVVPLDNGQKIPVEMKGEGGVTNIYIQAWDGVDVMRALTNHPEAVAAGVQKARRNNPGFLGE